MSSNREMQQEIISFVICHILHDPLQNSKGIHLIQCYTLPINMAISEHPKSNFIGRALSF